MRKEEKTTLYKCCMTAVILALATLLSLALQGLFVRAENVIVVYIVALLIIIIEFQKAAYGLAASACIVFLYQFLFTEPKYAFRLTDYNDWFVAAGIFVIEIVVSTLVSRMRRQMERSERNERRTEQLFSFSNGLLAVPGKEILSYGVKTIEKLTGRGVCVVDANGNFLSNPVFFFEPQEILHEIAWCDKSGKICGAGENRFPDLSVRLYPLRGASTAKLGVLALDCSESQPDKEETAFLLALASQLTVALDREAARQSAAEERSAVSAISGGEQGAESVSVSGGTVATRGEETDDRGAELVSSGINTSGGAETSGIRGGAKENASAASSEKADGGENTPATESGSSHKKGTVAEAMKNDARPTEEIAAEDSPAGLTKKEQAAVFAFVAESINAGTETESSGAEKTQTEKTAGAEKTQTESAAAGAEKGAKHRQKGSADSAAPVSKEKDNPGKSTKNPGKR